MRTNVRLDLADLYEPCPTRPLDSAHTMALSRGTWQPSILHVLATLQVVDLGVLCFSLIPPPSGHMHKEGANVGMSPPHANNGTTSPIFGNRQSVVPWGVVATV